MEYFRIFCFLVKVPALSKSMFLSLYRYISIHLHWYCYFIQQEFSLCPTLTKEVLKSRVFKFGKCRHPNFVSLDSLFFDKVVFCSLALLLQEFIFLFGLLSRFDGRCMGFLSVLEMLNSLALVEMATFTIPKH